MKRNLTIGIALLLILGLVIAVGSATAASKGVVKLRKGEPVHLAYWFVVSGPNTSLGMDTVRGIELAMEDFGGKVKGHPIKLTGQDTGCGPEGGAGGRYENRFRSHHRRSDRLQLLQRGPGRRTDPVGSRHPHHFSVKHGSGSYGPGPQQWIQRLPADLSQRQGPGCGSGTVCLQAAWSEKSGHHP